MEFPNSPLNLVSWTLRRNAVTAKCWRAIRVNAISGRVNECHDDENQHVLVFIIRRPHVWFGCHNIISLRANHMTLTARIMKPSRFGGHLMSAFEKMVGQFPHKHRLIVPYFYRRTTFPDGKAG